MAVRRTDLVRVRKAAGFTQESLAEAMHVDRSTVARWERGTREPLPYQRPKLARLLEVSLIGLDELLHREREASPQPLPSACASTPPTDASSAAGPYGDSDGVTRSVGYERRPVAVREVIGFRTVSKAFRVADRKVGGGVLYGQVVRFLQDEVAPKLLVPPPGVTHFEVFSAAASFSEFAGWTAHDSGRDGQAKVHLTQAYHLATTAGNLALGANVLASLSHLAAQTGEAQQAERMALKGLSHVTGRAADAPHLLSRLHAMHGRALALQGREREARTALEAAEVALDVAMPAQQVEWLSAFDRASLAAEIALTMHDLRRYREAADSAAEAVSLRSSSDRLRSRLLASLTLANSLAAMGDPARAARVGVQIATSSAGLNSARVDSGIARLSQRLSSHAAVPEVAEMNDLMATGAAVRRRPEHQAEWPV